MVVVTFPGGWPGVRPPDGAPGLYRQLGNGDIIIYEDDPAIERDEASANRRVGRLDWTEQPQGLNDNASAA